MLAKLGPEVLTFTAEKLDAMVDYQLNMTNRNV